MSGEPPPKLQVRVATPAHDIVFSEVACLRFESDDGARGVLPGHEPARALVEAGPLTITLADPRRGVRYVATQGGLVWIDRDTVRIVSTWAAVAHDLDGLMDEVHRHDRERAQLEREARALAHRHEQATRRALARLSQDLEAR